MFHPVRSKVEFPKQEEEILKFWNENKIFEKSITSRRDSPLRFTLFEGPPTANGKPGIHHVVSRVFKDVIARYKTMKGYYAPRKAGWDTHGLPVELEIEKKLGFTSKSDIENYGIAKFNALCRDSVFTYLKEWNALTERIGYWLDIDHPYVTLDNSYIESVWWILKEFWTKGLIYLGYRVTPHCPRCGTSLSSHEIALGYKDDTIDPSVYIKFKLLDVDKFQKLISQPLKPGKTVYFLAWTTTPWTLPGNTALAISEKDEYCILENDKEYLVFASALIPKVDVAEYKKGDCFEGKKIAGMRYEPLFNPHSFGVERGRFKSRDDGKGQLGGFEIFIQDADKNLAYKVIGTDFVSMDDGTGIVHVAPAFGEVDFEAGRQFGLDFVQPVNLEGKMTGNYSFAGKFVKEADPEVLNDLQSRELLFKAGKISHTYPFCWRCDAPILYYAKKTWYIKTTEKKEKLIQGNDQINWYPDHIKYGRFGDWLQNNVDWALSRERYWGTPLNAWICESCGKTEFISGVADMKSKKNVKGVTDSLDLHRPYVDQVTYDCPDCGKTMNRVTEVIDCWFDSGSMPFAQWHYPFENKEIFSQSFPADYICEAVDQTRGWFYSLHAISVLLRDEPCYRNVICLGHILDAQGEKMSKTRGNVVQPDTILNKFGADAVRWYLFTSSPPGNVRRFSSDIVGEVQRNFLLTLWNTYSFFVMYANIDNVNPATLDVKPTSDLDVWILSHLNALVTDVDNLLNNYDPTTAGRKIETFVDDLSNWYIRRSRRRFWKSQSDTDKMSAYYTLYKCLVTVVKLMAPFAPFISEEIYRNLVLSVDPKAPESVHLAEFPRPDASVFDKDLVDATRFVIEVCSLGRSARAKAAIKVRQPLARVLIKTKSEYESRGVKRLSEQLLEELNVKQIEVVSRPVEGNNLIAAEEGDLWVAVDTTMTPELEAEGTAREIVRRLQVMRRAAGFEIADHIVINFVSSDSVAKVLKGSVDYISQETLADDIVFGPAGEGVYSEKHKLLGEEITVSVKKSK
jgi:isoleucyl-tRNA synthetase